MVELKGNKGQIRLADRTKGKLRLIQWLLSWHFAFAVMIVALAGGGCTIAPWVEELRRDGAEMVLIPAGEFWMGSDDGDADEKPRRRVYLDAFSIDKYEVTNTLYKPSMDATRYPAPSHWTNTSFNSSAQPVVGVSWYEAEAYCRWAGKRLPTEAEWEKAARGTDGRKYPWGNEEPDNSKANYGQPLSGGPAARLVGKRKTTPVGSYPSGVSTYGVHDMAGNVWEWVADWYDGNYYQRAPGRNPKGPDSGQFRVFRGGSWIDDPGSARSSNRLWSHPGDRFSHVGFRCAQ